MKVSDVEVIVSSKIDAEQLGIFYNSMHLSNYKFTLKSGLKDENSEKEEHESDARTKRTKQTLDSITVSHEKELESVSNFKFYKHCAEATTFARNLSNTRATPATPKWMED